MDPHLAGMGSRQHRQRMCIRITPLLGGLILHHQGGRIHPGHRMAGLYLQDGDLLLLLAGPLGVQIARDLQGMLGHLASGQACQCLALGSRYQTTCSSK